MYISQFLFISGSAVLNPNTKVNKCIATDINVMEYL